MPRSWNSEKTANSRFRTFLGVTFLRLVYFIHYLNTFVKNLLFSFFHLISVLRCYIFWFQFKFRGKKRNIKITNLDPKTKNGFSKFSLLRSILAIIIRSVDKFYRFFGENSGNFQFGRKKIEYRSHQLQLFLWEWGLFDELIFVFYPFLTG